MEKRRYPKLTELRGWSLKKEDKNTFTLSGTSNIGIVINQRISAIEFTGFIKLPRPRHTDFGFATMEWAAYHSDLGNPSQALITFNGKVFWEVIDIEGTDKINRVLMVLKRLKE